MIKRVFLAALAAGALAAVVGRGNCHWRFFAGKALATDNAQPGHSAIGMDNSDTSGET